MKYIFFVLFLSCSSANYQPQVTDNKAMDYLSDLCQKGDEFSCTEVAAYKAPIQRSEKRINDLTAIFKKGAEKNIAFSLYRLAYLHIELNNWNEAYPFLKKANELNSTLLNSELGEYYLRKGELPLAKKYLAQGCLYHPSFHCFYAGILALNFQNKELAKNYFKLSCDYSNWGCLELGKLTHSKLYTEMGQKFGVLNTTPGYDSLVSGKLTLAKMQLKKECENKSFLSCSFLGDLEIDTKKINENYYLACLNGIGRGCYRLSRQKTPETLALIKDKFSENISQYASLNLLPMALVMYENNELSRYKDILKELINRGDRIGQYYSAFERFENYDDNVSFDLFKKSCDQGFPESCFQYAIEIKRLGHEKKSSELMKQLCQQNNYPACNEIGADEDERSNMLSAKTYFEKGCQGLNKTSCFNLAEILRTSDRPEKAKEYFQMACFLGHNKSCLRL